MTVRTGVHTFELGEPFEFQQSSERPKTLDFAAHEDAANWLRNLWCDQDLIRRFREYLSRHSEGQEISRLTDRETIENLAVLLRRRRILVIPQLGQALARKPTPRPQEVAPPFPLSEREAREALAKARARSSSTPAAASNQQIVLAPLWIRLDLKSKQAAKETGSLRLVGSSGGYDQTLAIASSFVANQAEANTVDVLFENVPPATYTLTYIDAAGAQTTIVANAPFDSLKDDSMAPSASAPAADPTSAPGAQA